MSARAIAPRCALWHGDGVQGTELGLLDVIATLESALADGASEIRLDVLDPDAGAGRYAGEIVIVGGVAHVHRPFRVWVDLAERMGLRLGTPRPAAPSMVTLVFTPLDRRLALASMHTPRVTEKYGATSTWARVRKLEDPGFVLDLRDALARIDLPPGGRVLDLGVNTGDELALLLALAPQLSGGELVGVDHSASALALARARFPGAHLIEADLGSLPSLGLGRFDLVLSIGTLQSPGIDDREVVRQIVQHHLAPEGAVILGFPSCRYVDGEVEYGARIKNLREPELGLLIKDVAFYRKYLQQHGKRVFVTGKYELLVTGVPEAPQRRSS